MRKRQESQGSDSALVRETENRSKWQMIEPGYRHLAVRGNMTPAAQATH